MRRVSIYAPQQTPCLPYAPPVVDAEQSASSQPTPSRRKPCPAPAVAEPATTSPQFPGQCAIRHCGPIIANPSPGKNGSISGRTRTRASLLRRRRGRAAACNSGLSAFPPQVGKPQTFQFLGFTFICGQSRARALLAVLVEMGRPHANKAQGGEGGDAMAKRQPVREQGRLAGPSRSRLLRVSRSAGQYPCTQHVPSPRLGPMAEVSLKRRSQRDRTTWERIAKLAVSLPPENPASFILGLLCGLPTLTRGGSRVPEWGPLGSVLGALNNECPYRDLSGLMASS